MKPDVQFMFPRGHAGFAMIFYSFVSLSVQITNSYILAIGLLFTVSASISPDFDVIDNSVFKIVEHRGITHTIWFSIISFILVYSFLKSLSVFFTIQDVHIIYLAGVASAGYTSHLVGDILNEGGIRPFYIPSWRFTEWRLGIDLLSSQSNRTNNLLLILGSVFYVLSLIMQRYDSFLYI
jgi:membrane-bound metal-dependent hydrolase YbcI (DUF457 family)